MIRPIVIAALALGAASGCKNSNADSELRALQGDGIKPGVKITPPAGKNILYCNGADGRLLLTRPDGAAAGEFNAQLVRGQNVVSPADDPVAKAKGTLSNAGGELTLSSASGAAKGTVSVKLSAVSNIPVDNFPLQGQGSAEAGSQGQGQGITTYNGDATLKLGSETIKYSFCNIYNAFEPTAPASPSQPQPQQTKEQPPQIAQDQPTQVGQDQPLPPPFMNEDADGFEP